VLTRPALRAALRREGLRLGKRLGQNMLVSEATRDRLVEAMALRPDDLVVEIGAGTGALTEALARKAARVIAFEVDRGLMPLLGQALGGVPNVEARCEDFLKADLAALSREAGGGERLVLVGNLPYAITTPLITRVLESGAPFRAAYFTVQREVAQRLLAAAGVRDRGAITSLVEYHTEAHRLLSVPCAAFEPVPKVESVLIGLTARSVPAVSPADPRLMFAVIRAAFGARRKVLKNALRRLDYVRLSDDEVAAAMRACALDPKCRAEQLTLRQFADLSDALTQAAGADRGI
jgi:16S rRNA (adenine1518-N6/adenine1519-N6)-dimethyltransferase